MLQEIVFAAGCFWGVEKHFASFDGVSDVVSGYTAGSYENPTYELVLKHRDNKDITNHTEVVKVSYDDRVIQTADLIKSFWELHNPTQGDRQGNDIGNNYRSGIYWTSEEQEKIAKETKEIYQKLLTTAGFGEITTEIQKLDKFYKAEDYHQDYLAKNPNGYCPNHSTGVKFAKKTLNDKDNENAKQMTKITPITGKEIIIIKAEFCPYCEKLKKDVIDDYKGDLSLRYVFKEQLQGFEITTKLNASPIIILIENGKEIYSHIGYLNPKEFYKLLGQFKLGGDSESFRVAFQKGTDSRFCKQYDLFKDTGAGYFVDKLSGARLFDTDDRFNSGTGWLSFYKAIDGATIEITDDSFGMNRIEVIAKVSGAHLGHVFDGEIPGKRRFCINATVLDFVAK
jgi:peptide methionine sulfoxide reductase msrA/msrB